MKQFSYIIKDEIGLHARPAGLLAKEAKKYQSTVTPVSYTHLTLPTKRIV